MTCEEKAIKFWNEVVLEVWDRVLDRYIWG